ncbi:MAG TPA: nascent polypeptide-associated complex protein [Candidatus Aenigmarchaeota archaeon]|nr:MAG: nascent polypeptide-associated complex protein [Candidatus Aenigmarchaeota archaeon]HDI06477.1 nascent polypeptide-associated complex protein [Candidatus Aenigmarchaeota archaeon]
MFPNINPKQIEKIARKMGMEMENITATEVVIKTDGKDIVIKNPQVSKIRMQGQETFQISGEVIEQENIREEDVQLVMQKAGISKEEAEKLLKETGDIVLAIKKAKK